MIMIMEIHRFSSNGKQTKLTELPSFNFRTLAACTHFTRRIRLKTIKHQLETSKNDFNCPDDLLNRSGLIDHWLTNDQ